MLIQKVKRTMRGVAGAVVIGIIAISFALLDVGTYVTDNPGLQDLVVVGDKSFDRNAIGREIQIQRAKTIESFGQDRLPDNYDDQRIFNMALNELIASEFARQFGEGNQMVVGDAQLISYIQAMPDLQGEDGFDRQKLNDKVVSQGINLAQFEHRYRDAIIREQLEMAMQQSYLVETQSVELFNAINAYQRQAIVWRLPSDYFLERAEISEQQMIDYHQENRDQFTEADKLSTRYLLLSREQLIDGIEVSDEQLRTAWEQNQSVAAEEELRRARHILLALDEDASAEQSRAAFDKMTALRAELDAGASFAELAEEHSDDPGSAANGGDLGEVARGVMVDPFEQALFGLQEGEISEIVTSQFGLHLILLEEIISDQAESFEQARDDLRRQVAEQESFQVFEERLTQLRELAEQPDSTLDSIGQALSLEATTSDLAERTLLPEPLTGFGNQLFDDENFLEQEGALSEVLKIDDEQAMIVEKLEYQPVRQLEFDQARDQVEEELKQQFDTDQRQALSDKIESLLLSTSQFANLVDEDFAPLERTDYDNLSRVNRQSLSREEIETIFALRLPGATIGLEQDPPPEAQALIEADASGQNSNVTTPDQSQVDEGQSASSDTISNDGAPEEDASAEAASAMGDDQTPSSEDESQAIAQSPPEDRDFSYTIDSLSGLSVILVRAVDTADEDGLETGLSNAKSRIRSNQATFFYNAFYKYLQDVIAVDMSGLQKQ